MVRLEQAIIMSREAQSSDAATFRKNLPTAGVYSALDIGIRVTNGSTSAQGIDILDAIKHISVVFGGNDYRVHMSGHEMFRWQWMKNGKPMYYNWDQSASAVQEVWFRIPFGRFMGDRELALSLDKHNNVQVQIEYDMTAMGAAAVTTWTTGTFTITMIAHQFPYQNRPVPRGMIGLHEMYTTTTVASGDIVENLPATNPLLALSVMCLEDAIADAVDITDIKIGMDQFTKVVLDGKWYNFSTIQNNELQVREELFCLFCDDAQTVDTHLSNIKTGIAKCRAVTTAIV